ncbi:MAG: JAB domain-containing protein [Bacteroidetes bacterium]|nr:MAG: JAB domain-containing protein [Bacteroidota bacterium]
MQEQYYSIKNWAKDERPREKLLAHGAEILSNSELLAILINHGTKNKSAIELAKEILEAGKNNLQELGKLSVKELTKVKGIGEAKAITIVSAMELGRRRQASDALEKKTIVSSGDIASFLQSKIKDNRREVFAVLFLNRANKINHFEIISEGGITGTVADPRIILKKALEEDAVNIVLAHNHPSGSLKPSRADEELTHKIKEAAKYFDIKVLDHIIISDLGYYSFADEGLL